MSNKLVQLKDSSGNNIYPYGVVADGIYAPLESSYDTADDPVPSADDCVKIPKDSDTQLSTERTTWVGSMTDPITNSTIAGTIETIAYLNDETKASGSNVHFQVEQTFTQWNIGVKNNVVKFRRKGYLQTSSYSNIDISNISWKSWYPLEYPLVDWANKVDTSNFSDSSSNTHYLWYVRGGVLFIVLSPARTKVVHSGTTAFYISQNLGFPVDWFQYGYTGATFNDLGQTSHYVQLNVGASIVTLCTFGSFGSSDAMYGTMSIPLGY